MVNKKSSNITQQNIDKWLSILGFSFPRNEAEEKLFDKLFRDFNHELTGKEIDPFKLINQCETDDGDSNEEKNSDEKWKMAARNYDNLPKHIIDKMKKNHEDKT